MRLKANHLTAARVVLLPLPYVLLYGGTESRVAALVILAVLGITDYLDGLLARREGATALGALLDPLADKIFTAVMLLPLVDLEILPLWVVWPIFLREFLVTDLRHLLKQARKDLPVTELAKIKTTIQMTGAGLILLTDTFPERTVPAAFISGALLATVFLAVAIYIRDGLISTRMKVALGMLGAALAVRLVLDTRATILAYGVVMAGITLASGAQYVARGLPECLRQGPLPVMKLFASLAVPMLAVSLSEVVPPNYTFLVLIVLCLEFASQGIDMWMAQRREALRLSWLKPFLLAPAVLVSFPVLWRLFGLHLGTVYFLWMAGTANALYLGIETFPRLLPAAGGKSAAS